MIGPAEVATSIRARRVVLKRHLRALQGHEVGSSQPQVLGDVDGDGWMVKPTNNPQGLRVLVNEVVATALAARLGGAVRPFAICDLPDELATGVLHPDGRPWSSGPAFGSALLDSAVPLIPDMLHQAVNRDGLLAVVATDTWLLNLDSRQALSVPMPIGGYMVFCVDFGHTIGAPTWSAADLNSRPDPVELCDRNEWKALRARGMAARLANVVESVTDDEITELVEQVPSEWNVSGEERAALRAYICRRRPIVASLMRDLESKETAA